MGKRPTWNLLSFHDVYPLYGLADIRSSSIERNKAIQADLVENLEMVRGVLDKAFHLSEFPIYKEIDYRIKKYIKKITSRINSSDENRILKFLKTEVEPTFNYLKAEYPALSEDVDAYFQKMDPKLGLLYKKRKQYEESVTKINEVVGNYLDQAEEEGQAIPIILKSIKPME